MTELLTDAHFWVGIAFLLFMVLMVAVGVHKLAWNALGESGRKVQAHLDEAAHLRDEAQSLLAGIKVERAAAEREAAEMLKPRSNSPSRSSDVARWLNAGLHRLKPRPRLMCAPRRQIWRHRWRNVF